MGIEQDKPGLLLQVLKMSNKLPRKKGGKAKRKQSGMAHY